MTSIMLRRCASLASAGRFFPPILNRQQTVAVLPILSICLRSKTTGPGGSHRATDVLKSSKQSNVGGVRSLDFASNMRKDSLLTDKTRQDINDHEGGDLTEDDSSRASGRRTRKYINLEHTSLLELFEGKKKMTYKDWNQLHVSASENKLTRELCDSLVLRSCLQSGNISLAKSYVKYVEKHKKRSLNLGSMSLYLELSIRQHDHCTETEILSLVDRICAATDHPIQEIMDKVIRGVCLTSRWKESYKHLAYMTKGGLKIPVGSFVAVCSAAFRADERKPAWHFFGEVCLQSAFATSKSERTDNRDPFDTVVSSALKRAACISCPDEKEKFLKVLGEQLGRWQKFPAQEQAEEILSAFESCGWRGTKMSPTGKGQCSNCGHTLKLSPISEESFAKLKSEFVEKVVHAGDLYLKTTPQEWDKFQGLVRKRGPFTHVLDGLNIGLGSASSRFKGKHNAEAVKRILCIVSALKESDHNSNILVVGREHMRHWERSLMAELHRETSVCFLDNFSHDDCYIQYFAILSGVDCKIVTRDLFRDHASRLSGDNRRVFTLWRQRVLMMPLDTKGWLRPQEAARFTTACELTVTGGSQICHLPYNDGSLQFSYDLPTSWLCLTKPS